MMAGWLHLTVLLVGQHSTVSTDELDRYVDQAIKAENACGPTAVWYSLRRLGHNVSLNEAWAKSKTDQDGTNLEELVRLANSYGVRAQALACSNPSVNDLYVPTILIINDSHCVVFDGVEAEGQKVRYFEPAQGKIKTISRENLERQWSGKAIVFWKPALSPQMFSALTILAALGTVGLVGCGKYFMTYRRLVRLTKTNKLR